MRYMRVVIQKHFLRCPYPIIILFFSLKHPQNLDSWYRAASNVLSSCIIVSKCDSCSKSKHSTDLFLSNTYSLPSTSSLQLPLISFVLSYYYPRSMSLLCHFPKLSVGNQQIPFNFTYRISENSKRK